MKDQSKVKSSEDQIPSGYQVALDELESILAEIESGEADVDVLSLKVKRALFLITFCRARLTQTDEEVRKLIQGLDAQDNK